MQQNNLTSIKNNAEKFFTKFWSPTTPLLHGVLRLILQLNGENYCKSWNPT